MLLKQRARGRTSGRVDGQVDGRTDERTDGRTHARARAHARARVRACVRPCVRPTAHSSVHSSVYARVRSHTRTFTRSLARAFPSRATCPGFLENAVNDLSNTAKAYSNHGAANGPGAFSCESSSMQQRFNTLATRAASVSFMERAACKT